MTVTAIHVVMAVVIGLMLAEARVSRKHERALRTRGAVEPPDDVYRAMLIMYPGAFVLMYFEGVMRAEAAASMGPGSSASPAWWLAGILLMVASKALKYWAIAHLRDRWSFRVLVLPGAPLVRSGPYRYVDHPNYIAVVGELAAMALMMAAWTTGPLMIVLFGIALWLRLRVETRALHSKW
jgi:methyltransferase